MEIQLTILLSFIGSLILWSLIQHLVLLSNSYSSNGTGTNANSRSNSDGEVQILDKYYKFGSSVPINGPGSKVGVPKFPGPTLRIFYCSFSSGYKQMFEEYEEFLSQKYPEITVIGEGHGGPRGLRIIAQILMILKFCLIGLLLTNQWTILRLLLVPPRIISWISENRFYSALLFYVFTNLVESHLVGTGGAFEILWDDIPVWSKMQCGRLPNPPELIQIIENQLKLGGREKIGVYN